MVNPVFHWVDLEQRHEKMELMNTINYTQWASVSFTLIMIFELTQGITLPQWRVLILPMKHASQKRMFSAFTLLTAGLEPWASLHAPNQEIDTNPNLLSRLASQSEWQKKTSGKRSRSAVSVTGTRDPLGKPPSWLTRRVSYRQRKHRARPLTPKRSRWLPGPDWRARAAVLSGRNPSSTWWEIFFYFNIYID